MPRISSSSTYTHRRDACDRYRHHRGQRGGHPAPARLQERSQVGG